MYNFQQNRGTTSERLTLRSSTEHKSNKKHTDKRSLWKKKHTHCLKKCIPLNPKATLLSKQYCIDSQDIVFLFRISRDHTVYTNSYCNQSINQSIKYVFIYSFIYSVIHFHSELYSMFKRLSHCVDATLNMHYCWLWVHFYCIYSVRPHSIDQNGH